MQNVITRNNVLGHFLLVSLNPIELLGVKINTEHSTENILWRSSSVLRNGMIIDYDGFHVRLYSMSGILL